MVIGFPWELKKQENNDTPTMCINNEGKKRLLLASAHDNLLF